MKLSNQIIDKLAENIKPIMNDKEVMELLNISSKTTLYKFHREGLKFSQVGSLRYYTYENVMKFIDENEV